MKDELILKNINKHVLLTSEEEAYFMTLLNEKVITKKSFLLMEGQNCKTINFVNAGILRAYYDNDGKESTIMFAMEDWWVTDMYCYINQQPAMLNIVAIEDSSILQLSIENLEKLYLKIPKFERFFRILFQNAYIREQLRVIQNLSQTAEQRYHNFQSKYPKVLEKITQKQIASYLGITPEFLSMIRARK